MTLAEAVAMPSVVERKHPVLAVIVFAATPARWLGAVTSVLARPYWVPELHLETAKKVRRPVPSASGGRALVHQQPLRGARARQQGA